MLWFMNKGLGYTVNAPDHEWAISFMIDTLDNWVNSFLDSGSLFVSKEKQRIILYIICQSHEVWSI